LITKFIRYQYGVTQVSPSVNVHLRNFNKQQLILREIRLINAPFNGNQTAKFQLNLPKQTIATTAFVR